VIEDYSFSTLPPASDAPSSMDRIVWLRSTAEREDTLGQAAGGDEGPVGRGRDDEGARDREAGA
jgi:hypothetical protein